jgi:hypothetical protein
MKKQNKRNISSNKKKLSAKRKESNSGNNTGGGGLTHSQRLVNDDFLTNTVIGSLKEGGFWTWPDEGETFIMQNGKLIGSLTAITKLKKITTPVFYNNLIIK